MKINNRPRSRFSKTFSKTFYICHGASSLGATLVLAQTAFAGVSLRGSHNNWAAAEMLYQGYYNAADIVTFSNCSNVEFKFDIHGDWKENYGDNDNIRGMNPWVNLMEGRLDPQGANIRIDCNKTYYISMNHFSGSGTYGFRELNAQVPSALPSNSNAIFRRGIRGGGFYGAVSITGEILVREESSSQRPSIEISYKDTQGNTRVENAQLFQSLGYGLEVWRFQVGSYGSIDIESIVYKLGDVSQEVEINSLLLQ